MDYHRRSIRLNQYDYSENGYYFVTICVQNKLKLFWNNENLFNGRADTGVCPYIKSKEISPYTKSKEIFSDIKSKDIRPKMESDYKNKLNDMGKMIWKIWNEIPNNYDGIEIDEFVVMPNHIHGILIINKNVNQNKNVVGVDPCVDPNKIVKNGTLGIIINKFKTLTTKIYIKNIKQNNWPRINKRLFQRNYYERIIRNKKEYLKIKEYIKLNPIQ